MARITVLASAVAAMAALWASSAFAGQMRQSPAMMRRAGPSCTPGHLGGSRYAGYNYLLGPCRAVEQNEPQGVRPTAR